MNSHQSSPVSFGSMLNGLMRNRALIYYLSKREVLGRYRGSFIGVAWSFFNPVLMLVVYTFVFSVVFKSRWANSEESNAGFALVLFVGMIIHGLFSETIIRAPSLILSNVNYVKKVVFPLEILPIVSICNALFHSSVSVLVLLLAFFLTHGFLNWTVVFLPLVFLPLVLFSLGISWFFAALGVFIRDISQGVGLFATVMLFLSPVFFPVSALPEKYRIWMMLNPLTFVIEQARAVLLWGHTPDYWGIWLYSVVSVFLAWGGYIWFQKTRRGFADVL